jgi:predicted nuclease of predicted toxin-antitoxin system
MKFLVDEDLPRSTAALVEQFGHIALDVRDVGLRGRPDEEVIAYAQQQGCCLLSADWGFANTLAYPPRDYPGIVILELPPNATAKVILRLLSTLLDQRGIVERLTGRLALVQFGRVRLRPSD